MNRVGRLFHTVRYLRPTQITARARFRLLRPRPELGPAPSVRRIERKFVHPVASAASMVGPSEFRFLNVTRALRTRDDWNNDAWPKLWLYNLHYFDDLNARDAPSRAVWHRELIHRWIHDNRPGHGNGWEPYPVSRRVANWIKSDLLAQELTPEARHSLAVQVRWLRRRLEHHLLGNHLIANAKALVFAGAFFEGQEASAWLEEGVALLSQELKEQILADGGHVERSPMYHAIVLEDSLDVINVLRTRGIAVPAGWEERTFAMRRWLRTLAHPDAGPAFFNDSAFGIAPDVDALDAYAERLGQSFVVRERRDCVVLRESGYVRLERGEAVVLIDCAPIGPDYMLGHAHADTLSFELSLRGARVLVNSGTSEYGVSPERLRQRGTAAHNTVAVDGQDSSEVWHGFRVARRARPSQIVCTSDGGLLTVEAGHDGYVRLPGRNMHNRKWILRERSLTIEDIVTEPFQTAAAYVRLHPDVAIENFDSAARSATGRTAAGLVVRFAFTEAASLSLEASTYHPEFGRSLKTRCFVATLSGGRLRTEIAW